MLTKQEIYDSLKNDGAKLRAINFTTKDELVEMYKDRFGIDPYEESQEQPNTEKLSDGDDFEEKSVDKNEKIPLLKFSFPYDRISKLKRQK